MEQAWNDEKRIHKDMLPKYPHAMTFLRRELVDIFWENELRIAYNKKMVSPDMMMTVGCY